MLSGKLSELNRKQRIKTKISIFICFTIGAKDPRETLVSSTFTIVDEIMKKFFPMVTDNIEEVVNCLVSASSLLYSGLRQWISVFFLIEVREVIRPLAV